MDRNSSSSPSRRFTSPNRYGLVARDKPVLEFPNGHPKNRWDSLSTESSLSTIAGAEICPISKGGLLCNIAGIRREEGDAINPNSLQLGRCRHRQKIFLLTYSPFSLDPDPHLASIVCDLYLFSISRYELCVCGNMCVCVYVSTNLELPPTMGNFKVWLGTYV